MVAKAQHYINNPDAFLKNSAMKSAQNQYIAQFIGSGISNLTSIFLYRDTVSSSTTKTEDTEPKVETSAPKEEAKDVVESDDDIKKNIIEYLKDTGIETDDSMMTDLLKKYKAIKAANPDIEADNLASRLSNYAKALQARKIELKMSAEALDLADKRLNDEISQEEYQQALKSSDLKIVDNEIADTKNDPSSSEFKTALVNRGSGYVDLCDTDGDQKVSFDEFIAFAQQESTTQLSEVEIELSRNVFNLIDKDNNQSIDVNEMASHLYAISRLHDEDGKPSTTEDLTLAEWNDAQQIGINEDYTNLYTNLSDQLYNSIK